MRKDTIIRIDYLWIDNIQTKIKTRILKVDLTKYDNIFSYIGKTPKSITDPELSKIPIWDFDGTLSNNYTEYKKCILKPVRLYQDVMRPNSFITLCEVLDENNNSLSTYRNLLKNMAYGIENIPTTVNYEFSNSNSNKKSANYKYCSPSPIDDIVSDSLHLCIESGINLNGWYKTDLDLTWSCELSEENVLTMCDNIYMFRYIIGKIHLKNKEYVNFTGTNSNIQILDRNITCPNNIDVYETFYKILKGE